MGGRDCLIIATVRLAGIQTIATHDRAFKKVEELTVIDDIPSREPGSKKQTAKLTCGSNR